MDTNLEIQAKPHPDPRVRRVGFDLSDPYIEQCWGAVLGPSGVAVLRRMPTLWREREPAQLPSAELAATFGLPGGASEHGKFSRTVNRLAQFRLAEWIDQGSVLAVYTEVAPLTDQALRRVPDWTKETHQRLLGEHLDGIATRDTYSDSVADITARLDRLQQPQTTQTQPGQALGR